MQEAKLDISAVASIRSGAKFVAANGAMFLAEQSKVVIGGKDYFLIDAVTEQGRKAVTEAGHKGRRVHERTKTLLGKMEFLYAAAYRLEANTAMIYESGKNSNDYKISYHENPAYLLIIGVTNLEVKLITEAEFKGLITEDRRRNPDRKTFAEIEAKDAELATSLMANYDSLPTNSELGRQFAGFVSQSLSLR